MRNGEKKTRRILKSFFCVSVFTAIFFFAASGVLAYNVGDRCSSDKNATCQKQEGGIISGVFSGSCPSGYRHASSLTSNFADCGSGMVCCISDSSIKDQNYQTPSDPSVYSKSDSSASAVSSSDPGGLVPCDNCTLCHIVIGFKRIYEFFLKLLFVATMLAITVSGVFYMVSAGSKTLTEMAKKALTYSLTAFVIGMAGWIIINTMMTALGYQHPYGGRWWEFTCDTTPSKGPVSSGRTITGSGGGGVAPGDGTCGGVSVAQNSGQCNSASKELENTLACVKNRVSGISSSKNSFEAVYFLMGAAQAASSLSILSLGQNQNNGNWQACVGENWNSSNCPHVKYSCHYGGRNCQGQINAADLTGSNLSSIAAAAKECNSTGTVLFGDEDHKNHVHVSVNNAACGCR